VVGGGVSGLEAARVASLRGHQVTLFEKSTSLGGHLIEASVPDFKKDLERLLAWYKVELEDLSINLKVRLGVECTEELIRMENPDITILATGSKPILPDFPGIYKDKVATAPDVLLGRKEAGQKVVVVGGGLIGCETALWLVKQGKKVTIVETLGELMVGGLPVPHPNRMMLLDLLKLNRVDTITYHSLFEVTDQSVLVISKESQRKELESDTVVLTLGLESDHTLYKALLGKISNLYLIGDSREPRNIMGSIWDAYEVARVI
jgi:2-enoate reductase